MIGDLEARPPRFDDRTLQALFEAQEARTPERTAVVCGEQRLSYRELNARANQVAHGLLRSGAGPDLIVALYLERSVDLLVCLLGVLKAGAAYLPLDLDSPPERLRVMLADAAPAAVIAHAHLAPRLSAATARVLVVSDDHDTFANDPTTNPCTVTQPSHLAYVIYTSGSSGTPKGVLIEHRSVVGMFRGAAELFSFNETDVWTLFHSAAFDFSVWEIWGAWLHGARVVVVPRAIARSAEDFYELCVREGVTVLSQTPSAFAAFADVDADRGRSDTVKLRYVVFGGEALDCRLLQPWFERHRASPRMINMYGITETTVHVTFRLVTASDAASQSPSPIGQALPGYRVSLRGDDLRQVSSGETGEICVGGVGLARGYLNRAELTAQRFVVDPEADPASQARLYRSGDLGCATAGGDIQYLGRSDQQVKIRGYRIEVGEIEVALAAHHAIARVVVVMREDRTNDRRLVAYWVSQRAGAVTPAELRTHAAARLPEYMIPSAFVKLATLPLTTNGKLDRQALPAPERIEAADAPYEAPRDHTESVLAAVFAEVLGRDHVGIHDHFFACGGHSLLVMQATARMRARLGVQVPVSLIFNHPTIASLAPAVRLSMTAVPITDHVAAVPHGALVPISFAQRGLWLLEQLTGCRSAYLLAEAWRLQGPLDAEALRAALDTIVSRHAVLRTRFTAIDGHPQPIVDSPSRFMLPRLDLVHLAPPAQDAEVRRLAAEEADRPFDLTADPLLRARLVAVGDDDHILLVTVHHIASDAWSQFLLHRELGQCYDAIRRGADPSLPALSITYADYAARQVARLTGERVRILTSFWRAQLASLPRLELPTDRMRPAAWSDDGAELEFEMSSSLLLELERLAAAQQVTLQMLLVTVYAVLLARYSDQRYFGVATFTAGREDDAVEDVIGLFVNTLVLRVDLSDVPTFTEALQRMRSVSLGAYDHQALPFETLVAELAPERRGDPNPLAQVSFQFLSIPDAPPGLDRLDVSLLPPSSARVRFDIEMAVWRQPQSLRVVIGYSTALFNRATIARFAEAYQTLVAAVLATPECPVDALPLVSDDTRDVQVRDWSGASTPATSRGCVHHRFTGRAHQASNATAVRVGERQLSYAELDERSQSLARHLRSIGVGPGTIVALHFERSIEMVVAMLSVLNAGAAYLPLDPSHPATRSAFMLRDLEVETLLTCGGAPTELLAGVTRVITLAGESDAWPDSPSSPPQPSDLACVMYTSGSAGLPKAVGVPHRAILRLVQDCTYITLQPSDHVAFAANVAFDASTFEIWGALLNGAELVVLDRDTLLSPRRLADAIGEQGITVMFVTTALFQQVVTAVPTAFSPLRYLLVGGEVIDPALVNLVLASGRPRHFLHVYGPTENTTFSTSAEITAPIPAGERAPIGRPISGSTCYVLDPHTALLPAGASGELCVGGDGLAIGYLRRPETTAERFVPHPFAAGERLYRTGDRARWRSDGTLDFLGRRDRQIKLRGHRIELGEIEHVLCACDGVDACVVTLIDDRTEHARLVAYWVARTGVALSTAELRDFARHRLPAYMVPSQYIELTSLPLTANGKVDRAALPRAPLPQGPTESTEPQGALEKTIAAVFCEVLGLESIGRLEEFFDLGGTSLSAFRLADRLMRACGRPVSIANVFAHASAAELAHFLETAHMTAAAPSIVEMRRGTSPLPLYFPPGVLGEVHVDSAILDALPAAQRVYTFADPAGCEPLTPSMEVMAARFVRQLQAFQPEGPICLAGYSFAGLLAFEMARQLLASGRQIALLAIFDTGPDLSDHRGVAGVSVATGRFLGNLPLWIAEDLVRTFGKDTPARLLRSLRKAVRAVGRRMRPQAAGRPHDRVSDLFDVRDWSAALHAHVENNLIALTQFRYQPYPDHLVLLRAKVRPLFNSHSRDLGWGLLARQVSVIDVPGNHHSMTIEPHVRVLGQALRSALDRAAGDPRDAAAI